MKLKSSKFIDSISETFVFTDICICGHKSNEHTLSNDQCSKKEEFCNCLGFLA